MAKKVEAKELKNKVTAFLKSYKMDITDIDMDKNVKAFLSSMTAGLAGKKGALEMLPTYLETETKLEPNQPVIVMDAGGTNVRVATIRFDDSNQPGIENFQKYSMPGVKSEVNKEKFFAILADYLKDVVQRSDKIGFCFSYPTESIGNKDGRLLRFSKEIKAKEVEGEIIGENLNHALGALEISGPKHVVLLNDTVATLLAGVGYKQKNYDGYIGFILGTGTNCSYIELNKNIKKTKGLIPSKSQIINIESGGFNKSQCGKIDDMFDKTTINPGMARFEKMISGAYLGALVYKVIEVAATKGLFSKKAAAEVKKLGMLETKDLNDFLHYPNAANNILGASLLGCEQSDIIKMFYLVDSLIERAAKLTAINLSSAAIKSGRGKNPCRPICIVAEGTTFYQLRNLKQRVEFYLKSYLENKKEIYCEIIQVENATLIGAAIAGLTN
jgi:hexokinase